MKPIIGPVAIAPPQTPPAVRRDPRLDKLRHAATEFESMLVKQLLKASKIGSTEEGEKSSGYADMAVDALATAVERGGGLGLSRRIEQAVGPQTARAVPVPGSDGALKVP